MNENKTNFNKAKYLIFLTVAGMVTATLGIWVYMDIKKSFDISDLILIGPVVLVLLLVIPVLLRYRKSIARKEPLEDERSNKAKLRAASLSFYISIYLLLFIGWFGDVFFERPSQATGAGIMGMAIIFLLSWYYFEKKENL